MSEPLVRVEHGLPDDVDVAALVGALVVLLDDAGKTSPAPPPQPATWAQRGWAAPHAWTT